MDTPNIERLKIPFNLDLDYISNISLIEHPHGGLITVLCYNKKVDHKKEG